MYGNHFLIPGKMGYWLICIAVIGGLMGCTPKVPKAMSEEDLQTCDDSAALMKQNSDITKPVPVSHPNLVQPGEAEIDSPLSASILPYGEPVAIKFNLPPADAGVKFRNYRIIVTTLTGKWPIDWVGDQFAVVSSPASGLQKPGHRQDLGNLLSISGPEILKPNPSIWGSVPRLWEKSCTYKA